MRIPTWLALAFKENPRFSCRRLAEEDPMFIRLNDLDQRAAHRARAHQQQACSGKSWRIDRRGQGEAPSARRRGAAAETGGRRRWRSMVAVRRPASPRCYLGGAGHARASSAAVRVPAPPPSGAAGGGEQCCTTGVSSRLKGRGLSMKAIGNSSFAHHLSVERAGQYVQYLLQRACRQARVRRGWSGRSARSPPIVDLWCRTVKRPTVRRARTSRRAPCSKASARFGSSFNWH